MNINDRINKIDKFFKDLNSNEIVELIKKNGYSNENYKISEDMDFYIEVREYQKIVDGMIERLDNIYMKSNNFRNSFYDKNNFYSEKTIPVEAA